LIAEWRVNKRYDIIIKKKCIQIDEDIFLHMSKSYGTLPIIEDKVRFLNNEQHINLQQC